MDPKAVQKARNRLVAANAAISAMESSRRFNDFAGQWYFFLVAAKNIYTVLETGAKVSPQSRQWFGAKANFRKSDPLLQYLFEARDDDEHGLNSAVEYVPGAYDIGVGGPRHSKIVRLDGGPFSNVVVHLGDGGVAATFAGMDLPDDIRATALAGC